jgi:hypothetical protein
MAVAVTRLELDADDLRREATRCRDAKAARRMLALALVLEGASREGGRARRDGPADLAGLGAPLQRRGLGRAARPAASGAHARAAGRAPSSCRERGVHEAAVLSADQRCVPDLLCASLC